MSKLSTNQQMLVQRVLAWAMVGGLALLAIYGAGWLAWQAALQLSPDAARVWALLATALLPVAVFVTWRLALRYAAGLVTGIGLGVNEVAKAGSNVADLRLHMRREARQPSNQAVILPDVEVTHRQLTANSVVEL